MNNQQQNKTNGFAIAGFITSFFFSIIPLVLCIIGISKAKECNSGKGLAVAGLIITIFKVVISVVIIALYGVIFSTLIWPEVKQDIINSTNCSMAYDCVESESNSEEMTCKYKDENNNELTITCPVSTTSDYSYES